MAGANIKGNMVGAGDEGYQPPQVSAVFGEPVAIGDKTLIQVSRCAYIKRLGRAASETPRVEAQPVIKLPEGSSYSGAKPGVWTKTQVAVIEVSRGKVRVKPIARPRRLALVGMLLAGWNVYWVFKTARKRRARG